jgi:DNA (cytosine-5)-methyltransferase 1
LDGEQFVPLNGKPIQQAYCAPDKMTKFSRLSRFGMTYKPLTENLGEELLTLYLEDFHAKTSAQQDEAQELTENDQVCGSTWQGSLARLDPDTLLWKTAQCSLLEDLELSLQTFPRWGLMQNGALYPLPTLVQTISEKESGLEPNNETFFHTPNTTGMDGGSNSRKALKKRLVWPTPIASRGGAWRGDGQVSMIAKNVETYEEYLLLTNGTSKSKRDRFWPTPLASDWKPRGPNSKQQGLGEKVKWPTPTANEDACGKPTGKMQKMLGNHPDVRQDPNGGTLNPTWVEWLMGWPLGFTDLKPLEMDKCHCAQQQLGNCLNE